MGAPRLEMPFSALVSWKNGISSGLIPPSGPNVGQNGGPHTPLLTSPTALKVSTVPGWSEKPFTATGDWSGATSVPLAREPGGIPANQRSDIPGTTTAMVSARPAALSSTSNTASRSRTIVLRIIGSSYAPTTQTEYTLDANDRQFWIR